MAKRKQIIPTTINNLRPPSSPLLHFFESCSGEAYTWFFFSHTDCMSQSCDRGGDRVVIWQSWQMAPPPLFHRHHRICIPPPPPPLPLRRKSSFISQEKEKVNLSLLWHHHRPPGKPVRPFFKVRFEKSVPFAKYFGQNFVN